MSSSNEPPTYVRVEAAPPLYRDLLPQHFTVGGRTVEPVVSVEELIDHLRLLDAFSLLKAAVDQANQDGPYDADLDGDAAWTVFLCRAVHRFERWITGSPGPTRESGALPPLDVLMVWHSYMLNPLTYKEDAWRVLPQLSRLGAFPLAAVAKALEPGTTTMSVSAEACKKFTSITGEPFDPPFVTTPEDMVLVSCPCCVNTGQSFLWPWINEESTGWAQRGFKATCPECHRTFDHEAFGVRKFFNDLIRWRITENNPEMAGSFLMAGVLKQFDERRGRQVMKQIFDRSPIKEDIAGASGASLAASVNWKMSDLVVWCTRAFQISTGNTLRVPPAVRTILRHYGFPGPFSMELTGAVMRQGGFIQKMVNMGWTIPDRFSEDPTPLVRSVARYHAFLDLMSAVPSTFFVPTLDIDLAWHTHQLKEFTYRSDTQQLIGRTPDHDDKVEENALSNAFDLTAQAWMKRYGVPYSVCGCLSPSESGISQTMRRLSSIIPGSSKRKERAKSEPPGPRNQRPDLVSIDDDDADATHPSDHNSVVLATAHESAARRAQRERRLREQLERRRKTVEQGRADAWTQLQERRANQKRREADEPAHQAAFFTPIAFWGVSPFPYGGYGYGGAACGTGGGGVISSCDGTSYGGPGCCAPGVAACAAGACGGATGSACGGTGGSSCGGGSGGCGGGGGGGCGGGS